MFLLVETTVSTQWLRPSDVEGRHCWWRGSKSCVVRRNGQKHGPTKLLSTWSRWCVYVLVECSRSKKSWRWKCWYTGRCCCNRFLFFLKFRRVLRSIHVRTILWLEMGHRNALCASTTPFLKTCHATHRKSKPLMLDLCPNSPQKTGGGSASVWLAWRLGGCSEVTGATGCTRICQTFPFHNCLLKMHTQDEDFYWYTKLW